MCLPAFIDTVPLIDAWKMKASLCRLVIFVLASITLVSVLPC